MKFGILFNKSNMNIGDDIQAYATGRFLPRIDYFIDRETLDNFKTDNGEPVAVIMNAWYMWKKWNWPPSEYIYPLMLGFHYADHQLANQWYGSPMKYEFLEGLGGDWLRAYSPVGCRDMFTLSNLKKLGIDSYFSGCITMTLPKMPETADKGSYICVVDVVKKVKTKLHEQLDDKIEIREISHLRERDENLSWDERKRMVEELLTVYQNARCVVTRRLHCALPCLAMGVPVLLVRGDEDDTRFDPYYDLLHYCPVDDLLGDNCSYDYLAPPPNKPDFEQYRDSIIKTVTGFVDEASKITEKADALRKTTYTPDELTAWRHDVMKSALDTWLDDDHRKHEVEVERKRELREISSALKKANSTLERKALRIDELKEKINEKNGKIYALRDEKKALEDKLKALEDSLKTTQSELETLRNEPLTKTIGRKLRKDK